MKPKTKLQKKVVKLSAKVREMTVADKEWANDILFDHYFVECRNRYHCLECGHKWNPENATLSKHILPASCPECGLSNLNHVDHWDTDESIYEYWAIIDVVEGFQVVRMFFAEKYLKRKQPAQYRHREVMQHWVREDGKVTSLTTPTNGMGIYNCYDSWSSGGELEPRTNSRNHKLRCRMGPYKIRPGRQTLPIIRRNGYCGYFKDKAPHQFFAAILKYPEAETLLKAGQESLFSFCVQPDGSIDESIEKYWDSICIAMRNDYIVENASDWLDYLGMLERLGKDLNSPHYVCPDDLEVAHNRYNEKIMELNRQEKLDEMKQEIADENPKYVARMKCFFGLHFRAGNLDIVPLKSVKEFLNEGQKLHHCIFNNAYYKKQNKLILSARVHGEPVENVEVDLDKLKVTQARGLQNKPTDHHDRIVDTVRENMGRIAAIKNRHEAGKAA